MKVYIAVVSNRDHKPMFVGALYALTQHITHQGATYGVERHVVSIGAGHSCLSMGREQAIAHATEHGFTHLLFLDDDMAFPPNVLQILLSKKLPVIGANYVTKTADKQWYVARDFENKRVSSKGKTGIEEITRIGMGVFLVELAAIRHIPAPHFEVMWDASKKNYISEDSYFCDKLRANGLKIYADHDASQQIGHVGDFVYTMHSF